jgi:glycosyltransferase involved in cell wall biosynthesis
MNIFIIPSWYPSSNSPIAGIFFKEQATYIGQLRPEWNIAISTWGQGQYALPIRKPLEAFTLAAKYWRNREKHHQVSLEGNVHEYYYGALGWTLKIFSGNIKGIIRANEINLALAGKHFGNIDIIHAHVSYPAGWIAMKLSEKYKIPYVITEHMSPFPFKQFLYPNGDLKKIVRQPLQNADAVIAVSPSLADCIQSFNLDRPIYIPNVVNEQFFIPSGRTDKHKNKYTFFTLGGMTPQKGIPDLVAAIRLFLDKLPQIKGDKVEFVIGGSGEEAEKYQLLAEQAGVSRWIRWLGGISRDEVVYHMQHCDCFVLASYHETFGVVFAEAIACGKPVIATRCGGPECIVNRNNGILVDVANPIELAEALKKMYLTSQEYNSNIIREDFLKRFSRHAVVDQLENVYSNVLNGRTALCVE